MINIASTHRSERLFAEAEAAYRETLAAHSTGPGGRAPETLGWCLAASRGQGVDLGLDISPEADSTRLAHLLRQQGP